MDSCIDDVKTALEHKTRNYTPEDRKAFKIDFLRKQLDEVGKELDATQSQAFCARYKEFIERIPGKKDPAQRIELDVAAVTGITQYLWATHNVTSLPRYTIQMMLFGLAIGMALRVSIGLLTDHLPMGLGIGMAGGY